MTVVPVRSPGSIGRTCSSSPSGTPRVKDCRHRWPRFLTSTIRWRRQRVDDRDADAVQAAGDLVAAAAELAAGVQHGQRHRDRGHLLAGRGVGRDAAAVVLDPDAAVGLQGHARSGRSSRPAPRRPRCRRSPRSGGAGRAHRSSRCTCRGACGPPRGPRGPGSRRRRTRRPVGAQVGRAATGGRGPLGDLVRFVGSRSGSSVASRRTSSRRASLDSSTGRALTCLLTWGWPQHSAGDPRSMIPAQSAVFHVTVPSAGG